MSDATAKPIPVEVGVPVPLAPGLARLTAPNPGVFTGAGTNTYLIGEGEVLVLDPGPNMPDHIEAILDAVEAAGGRIAAIAVTHTHPDHYPAARPLAERCGAPIYGMSQSGQNWHPDHELKEGDKLQYGGQTLRVLHTPGHASNHLCYLLEGAGILATGDHIIQGSTVVIGPPDGDMQHYMASLRRLEDLPLKALAPGHGTLMEQPQEAVSWLIQHRLKREDKVFQRLGDHPDGCDLDGLVLAVYDDVATHLHPIAKASLKAHLLKLKQEGRVHLRDERWYQVAPKAS